MSQQWGGNIPPLLSLQGSTWYLAQYLEHCQAQYFISVKIPDTRYDTRYLPPGMIPGLYQAAFGKVLGNNKAVISHPLSLRNTWNNTRHNTSYQVLYTVPGNMPDTWYNTWYQAAFGKVWGSKEAVICLFIGGNTIPGCGNDLPPIHVNAHTYRLLHLT